MAFPPPPIAADKAPGEPDTPEEHPDHHNEMATAINEIVAALVAYWSVGDVHVGAVPPDPLKANTLWVDDEFSLFIIFDDGGTLIPVQLSSPFGSGGVTTAEGVTIADLADHFTATNVEGALQELYDAIGTGGSGVTQTYVDDADAATLVSAQTYADTAAGTAADAAQAAAEATAAGLADAAEAAAEATAATLASAAETNAETTAATLANAAQAAAEATASSALTSAINALKAQVYAVNVHGANASAARITGFAGNIWFGSVQPTNAVDPDIVVRTDEAVAP